MKTVLDEGVVVTIHPQQTPKKAPKRGDELEGLWQSHNDTLRMINELRSKISGETNLDNITKQSLKVSELQGVLKVIEELIHPLEVEYNKSTI